MTTDESYRIEWKGNERVLIKNGTEVFTGTFKECLSQMETLMYCKENANEKREYMEGDSNETTY